MLLFSTILHTIKEVMSIFNTGFVRPANLSNVQQSSFPNCVSLWLRKLITVCVLQN